jgi:serine-type D-Ala-D-Ala carboxypeptidase/endopeptidase (penicillin-binding protein 4)
LSEQDLLNHRSESRRMFRRSIASVVASTALVLVATTPAFAAGPVSALDARLGSILAASGSTGMSVRVDVAGRGTVFTYSPSLQVAPASTEKLVTAFVALRVLGPGFRFVTKLGSTVAPDPHGVIHGRLVLTAAGDPTLTTANLDGLAARLHAHGVRTITGGILLDDSKFSRTRRAPSWKPEWSPGEVGALSAFAVDGNRCQLAAAACPSISNLLALKNALHKEGITVNGPLSVGKPVRPPRPLVSWSSVPLSAIVHDMLKRSVNFDAEMLLEVVGAATGDGTQAGGVKAIRAQAAGLKVTLGANIVDGSGLSYADRQTANAEVSWLEAIQRDPTLAPIIDDALPVGCDPGGTLHSRFCGLASPVHAKTGTLDVVRALTGYVLDAAGHRATFSFLVAGPPSSALAGKTAIDKAVTAIAVSHL